jgi:cell division protein FtsW
VTAHDLFHRAYRRGLTPVTVSCLFLGLVGCLAIYNATFHLPAPYAFVTRQLVWLGLGGVSLVASAVFPAQWYRRLASWSWVGVYLLLWLVLVFGVRVNGMRGWFSWREVFIQPSEIGKPFFILVLGWILERTHAHRREFLRGYLPCLGLLLVWVLPIALQPDFGTVLVYVLTFAAVYWCLDGRLLHLVLTGVCALPALVSVMVAKPYVWRRVLGFLDPVGAAGGAGWHIQQFHRALASGGLLGRWWGRGVWSESFLPLGYSDSIFATLAETMGFVGVLPLVLLVPVWAFYGYWRLGQLDSVLERAVVLGVVTMIGGQAFLHLSVNIGLVPPTGITLPLVSYGGSSLVSTLLAIGMVESVVHGSSTDE